MFIKKAFKDSKKKKKKKLCVQMESRPVFLGIAKFADFQWKIF